MNTNQPGHCSLNPNSALKEEEESLESKASPTIITLAVVLLMSASTTLSIVSGNYSSPKLEDLETFSLSKDPAKPNVKTPSSARVDTPEKITDSARVDTPEKITDSAQLNRLEQQLFQTLDQAWTIPVTPTSIYVVRVSESGAITAYTPINSIAQDNLQNTPLPELIQPKSQQKSENSQVKFAEFQVIFTQTGILEVQPNNLQRDQDF
ncbi:hypothetical protein [Lyngbya sp. PCC 8106]|uniref:hypothetical protein n=1 Tax=Lyngbya sp. (strain PCC 8106) TaxID=313612 RepID=UPI0000EA90D9|nr:hypothetical protein [Lyngbya sp. PCC 8106]EAW35285.1 hypothetical protein L8106_16149 [Lyngbya sp. PCC 8106]